MSSSPALATRLEACSVLDFAPDSPNDHVPVVATFSGFDEVA
jgi:exonuclease III